MRILHVISSLAPVLGGPSKACAEMAEAVAARGHDVAVYATDWGMAGEVDGSGRPQRRRGVVYRYFPAQFPRAWKTSWPLAAALRHDLRGYDVVHLHSLYLFHDLVVGRYCRKFGVPYVLRPHGTLDPYIRSRRRWRKAVAGLAFQNRVLRRAAAIHYTSDEEMHLAAPHARGAPGVVVPLGIDAATYADLPPAERFRARYPEIAERRIVLYLGRLHAKKGLDLLAAAFGRAAATRPDLHLVVAGPDDGARARFEGWLRAAGVRERTTFTGLLSGGDKLAALAAAEVFVLPSYSENFGIAVLEAMAAGRPVLISDKVNLWREVAGAGAGLIAPCDAPALAEALGRLLDDPAAARRMGQAGRAAARDSFGWDRIAARLEAVYESVVSAGRAST